MVFSKLKFTFSQKIIKYRIVFSLDLEQRTFSTLEFYRARQDEMTPAGLVFFQSDWDESLTDFYHKTLSMYFFKIISTLT